MPNIKIKYFKRFLDDIYIVLNGTTKAAHDFLNNINKIHSDIKFTMQHTVPYNYPCDDSEKCGCEETSSIPFLDTQSSIKEGKIIMDLYRKPTDRCMYLLTSSCHPAHVTNNIPYSLSLRIVRICSEPASRDQRLDELKNMLIERGYKTKIIDAAIEKAKKVTRHEALKRVVRTKSTDRPVFVATHDPRLPSLPKILKKHHKILTKTPHMASIYPLPPMVAFKRPKNIKDILIKAKVPPPPPQRPKRVQPGMYKCNRFRCNICPYVKEQKTVHMQHTPTTRSTSTSTTTALPPTLCT